MFVLVTHANKKDIKWLREWALFFALIGGMMTAVVWPL